MTDGFIRGCVLPPHDGAPYPRADLDDIRLPVDIGLAARVPATVRLELTGPARLADITYRTAHPPQGLRGEAGGSSFSVWSGQSQLADVEAVVGEGVARVPLGPGTTTVYLPEAMSPTVIDMSGVDGSVHPAPPAPRWLAYGDSITEGWGASAPARSWVARTSRELGLDAVNLGYAAAGRGELAVAEMIAATPAEVITVAFGTNCWSRVPLGTALLEATFRAFLTVLREGHPSVPVVVVSPIVRPDAEHEPNRLGATLAGLRRVIEETTRSLRAEDRRLTLLPGGDLLGPEHLADGVHPDDAGHELLSVAIGQCLAGALQPASSPT
ncbi:GDSL-type esterase/lipase family protein [Amycolatopsis sp.]|uniref:GDSL-type esterase/lipase family protein n=1 Tax=Amycolatopsis sp. TaxID=37632 RepID=UPI002C47B88A|nr:GDSL-type esterase/lipase family protein [Amycolatopsis sp.]HVV08117.1 GDSL-type esterase/lipase family protein [Amycolatopsis sp.]